MLAELFVEKGRIITLTTKLYLISFVCYGSPSWFEFHHFIYCIDIRNSFSISKAAFVMLSCHIQVENFVLGCKRESI